MNSRAVIVCGSDIGDYARVSKNFEEGDFFIYCDSGLKHQEKFKENTTVNITPNLIVGDFDSYKRPDTDIEVIELPREKDDTDSVFAMKEAINTVGDRLGLPVGWLNTDFVNTNSYTPRLVEHTKYYKTFSNILQIRTVSAEYLVAMKLMAGRQYKNDLSDIVGVLIEQEERDEPLSFEKIQKAVVDLYDSYDKIPEASRTFIEAVYKKEDLHEFYKQCRELEQENKDVLVGFQEDYPGVLNGDNLADILKAAKAKKVHP